jgi:thiamine pyrophosphate-dependent acetolactate synthase large subunit-like protein/nitrite reductase/ring-hydroxylating ferredoxin subunit
LKNKLTWYKVLKIDELPGGRVKSVSAANKSFAITHFDGKYSALNNKCPHQGGPLGEGNIENGWLRCSWHGYDFHPCTGKPPEGFDDAVATYPCEIKDDGIYIGLENTEILVKTVSDVMVETMINWGVTHVFGMVGHSNLGLADAFRKRVEDGKLKYIGIRHEGAASFAASAFAKLTGKPAACFSIAGPGATNLLTGLWDAKVDRAPLLALTGQVDTQVLGPGAFQEVDLNSAFGAVAEWKQTVLPSSKHAELMTLALKNAILKRDVSHLIFPNEVQQIPAKDELASSPEGRLTPQKISPPEEAIIKAVNQLSSAKRPVIVVGHGARFNMEKITLLADKLDAPVITTFKGKGLIPDNHPLACGVLGRSGTPIASWFMNEADMLLVFGASFSNHTGIAPYIPTIQVDFDPMALGKFHSVTVPVWGEIGITADILLQKIKKQKRDYNIKNEIADKWSIWKAEKLSRGGDDTGKGINSASVFAALNEHVPDNAVITVDVGNNAYSFGRYFECKRQSILMSGYLGSIGFGYPAAIGAWAAAPDRPIVAVTGDGGFAQYMAEVTTAVKYGMNIKHILLNNNELGKISKEQRADELSVWETELKNPDFSKYAELCGAFGIRVTKKEELEGAMKKAFEHVGPAIVEIITDSLLA